MQINLWAVLACGVLSMVLGFVWFGPLFGKKWMEICGADVTDMEKRKKMQKEAMPLYVIQFVLSLFQAYVLARMMPYFIDAPSADSPYVIIALWIALAFVIPTTAGASMWTADSGKIKWARFLIQGGYQLVLFVMFGLILGYWR